MNKSNLFKELIKGKPAQIIAKSDENNNLNIQIEGRGFDLLALSLGISENIIEKLPLSVDDYCDMLKEGCAKHGIGCDNSLSEEEKELKKAIKNLVDEIFSK